MNDQPLDELLDTIERGAQALGAREYNLRYIREQKDAVFSMLVNAAPDLPNLLRVWAWAVGVDGLETSMLEAIERGKAAREDVSGSGTPEQPEGR